MWYAIYTTRTGVVQMKQTYYAVLTENKLVNHKITWNEDTENHFVPVLFKDKKEAERYVDEDYKIIEVHIKVKDKLRYL